MKNKLTDLQNHLFELMEKITDDSIEGEALESVIKRSLTLTQLATVSIKNAELIANLAATYGYPVSGDLPLLPASPGAITPTARDKKLLKNKDHDDE